MDHRKGKPLALVIATVFLLGLSFYIYRIISESKKVSKNTTFEASPSSSATSLPVFTNPTVASIFSKTLSLATSDKQLENKQGFVWWVSSDNYNIFIPTIDSLVFKAKYSVDDQVSSDKISFILSKTVMRSFYDLVVNEVENAGYKKNMVNSSTSFDDKKYYDYVEAYEKNSTKCTITIDPDASGDGSDNNMYYAIYVACTDKYDEEFKQQQPFLKALKIHNAVISSIQEQAGDFYWLNINYRRTGHYSIVKKEGNTYKEIHSGQDVPPCSKMQKYNVPEELYETCFDY